MGWCARRGIDGAGCCGQGIAAKSKARLSGVVGAIGVHEATPGQAAQPICEKMRERRAVR